MTAPAIEVLMSEHALHRRMLAILERIARAVRGGAPFPGADVADVLGFFREFVETFHHAKEDMALYPLALSYGDDRDVEIVGRLVADHQETRELMHSLTLFWEPGQLLDEERDGFVALALAYGRRMRRHMEIEETSLFPRLEDADSAEMDEAVRQAVAGVHVRRDILAWRLIAAQLEERWTD